MKADLKVNTNLKYVMLNQSFGMLQVEHQSIPSIKCNYQKAKLARFKCLRTPGAKPWAPCYTTENHVPTVITLGSVLCMSKAWSEKAKTTERHFSNLKHLYKLLMYIYYCSPENSHFTLLFFFDSLYFLFSPSFFSHSQNILPLSSPKPYRC